MDRRQQYRVELEEGGRLETVLLESDNWIVCGRIVDLAADGAGVSITRLHEPVPVAGDTVRVRFPSALFNEPLSVDALVTHRTPGTGSLLFGLKFTNPAIIDGRIWQALRKVFNRRRVHRVEAGKALVVRVEVDGARAAVTALDISTNGVAVDVPMEIEWAHKASDRITLSMTLPGPQHLFNLPGIIRTRRLQPGAHIRYGLELELEDDDPRRAAIADYIGGRDEPVVAVAA